MKKTIFLITACGALATLGTCSGHADITLVDSVGFANSTGSGDDTDGNPATRTVSTDELGSFDAQGADKLVVTIGGEGESNGAGDNTVTGVTYGGVDMLPVLARYGNGHRGTSMWYLDKVTASGDFVITFAENQSGLGFGAYALDGTEPGFAETASTTATSDTAAYVTDMEMTTTVPGEFIVAAFARNNTDTGGGIGVEAPLIELFYGGTEGSSAAGAYQFVPSPSTVIPTIYRLSNNVGAVIAASFLPGSGPPGPGITSITPDADPANLVLTWESQAGKLYDIVGTTNPSADPQAWIPVVGDIAATAPENTETFTKPVDGFTAFAVIEKSAPPIFEDDFETDKGWTTGVDGGTDTDWERGTPSVIGPPAANSPVTCYGTNIDASYGIDVNIYLRSPSIDLSGATAATLSFQQFHDIEVQWDAGAVRVLRAGDLSQLGADVLNPVDGTITEWTEFSAALPPEALGENVILEFRFTSDNVEPLAQAGWYIDDVVLTTE